MCWISSTLCRFCSGSPLVSDFSSYVHQALLMCPCCFVDDHTSVLPPPHPPGSLLPYHPDAPLWQGLQNVQQDFPFTRVRHHRPSWRQWVVISSSVLSAMCSCWSLAIQSCVAFSNELSLLLSCDEGMLFFFFSFKLALNFLKNYSGRQNKVCVFSLSSSKGMSNLRRPGSLRVSRLLWGRGYHRWQD